MSNFQWGLIIACKWVFHVRFQCIVDLEYINVEKDISILNSTFCTFSDRCLWSWKTCLFGQKERKYSQTKTQQANSWFSAATYEMMDPEENYKRVATKHSPRWENSLKLYFVFDSVNKFFFDGIFHRKIWFKNLIEVKKSVTSNPPSPVDTDSRCSLIRPFINDLVVPRQKAQTTFFKVSHSVDVDFWSHTQQNLLNLELVLKFSSTIRNLLQFHSLF